MYFEEKNYALDHFIPHAFVSHDLIGYLLPIEKHFDKFYELQKTAYEINKQHNAKSKYMEEFLTIFPNIEEFEKDKFSNTIQPLITIASNNGFLFMNE